MLGSLFVAPLDWVVVDEARVAFGKVGEAKSGANLGVDVHYRNEDVVRKSFPRFTEAQRILPAQKVAFRDFVGGKLAHFFQCHGLVFYQTADLPQPKRKLKMNDNPVRAVDRLPALEAVGELHKRDKVWTLRMQALKLDLDGGQALTDPGVGWVRFVADFELKAACISSQSYRRMSGGMFMGINDPVSKQRRNAKWILLVRCSGSVVFRWIVARKDSYCSITAIAWSGPTMYGRSDMCTTLGGSMGRKDSRL